MTMLRLVVGAAGRSMEGMEGLTGDDGTETGARNRVSTRFHFARMGETYSIPGRRQTLR